MQSDYFLQKVANLKPTLLAEDSTFVCLLKSSLSQIAASDDWASLSIYEATYSGYARLKVKPSESTVAANVGGKWQTTFPSVTFAHNGGPNADVVGWVVLISEIDGLMRFVSAVKIDPAWQFDNPAHTRGVVFGLSTGQCSGSNGNGGQNPTPSTKVALIFDTGKAFISESGKATLVEG